MRNKKQPIEKHPIHVKSGDKVVVTSGKDKGKVSSVKKVITSENKVIVEGANIITKAQKAQGTAILGAPTAVEPTYSVAYGTDTINSVVYETAYLGIANYGEFVGNSATPIKNYVTLADAFEGSTSGNIIQYV